MSHSSKLITLDAIDQLLAALKQSLVSDEITVAEYLKLHDVFSDIDRLKTRLEELVLVLYVEDHTGGSYTHHLMVEKSSSSPCSTLGRRSFERDLLTASPRESAGTNVPVVNPLGEDF